MFENQEQHQMRLEKVHDSNAEEWVCDSCSRRMIIEWTPIFKRIVIEKGEENAIHSGSKGGLVLNGSALTISPSSADEPIDDDLEQDDQIISDDLLDQLNQFFSDLDDQSK